MEIEYTTRIFREGQTFVAHAPELDIASCGDTTEQARERLAEAVTLFVEEAERLGTLEEILEEAGYTRTDGSWLPPEVVTTERSRVGISAGAR